MIVALVMLQLVAVAASLFNCELCSNNTAESTAATSMICVFLDLCFQLPQLLQLA